ncbi:unnamed protein product [Aphanomyces euteiches]
MESDWDFLDGLPFLAMPAGDGQPLSPASTAKSRKKKQSPPSDDSGTSPSEERPKTIRHERRRRDEIQLLRDQVSQLEAQIPAMSKSHIPTAWERRAMNERREMNKAMVENQHLRQDVEQHQLFIQHLQNVLRKKPRLSAETPPEEWQLYKLPADEFMRTRAMHAIADRQLQRMDNAFLRAKLVDLTEDVSWARPSGANRLETASRLVLPAHYRVVSAAAWDVFRGVTTSEAIDGVTDTTQMVDAFLAYNTVTDTRFGDVLCRANVVQKYYPAVESDVIVTHSIVEDALISQDGDIVEQKWSWIQLVPLGPDICEVTFLVQWEMLDEGDNATSDEDVLANMMEKVSIALRPTGTSIPEVSQHDDGVQQLSLKRQFFAERSLRFQKTLKGAINSAIREYSEPKKRGVGAANSGRRKGAVVRQIRVRLALKTRLDAAKAAQKQDATSDLSAWKRMAKVERMEKGKAIKENEELREAVAGHATFIESMQKVFEKKPRLEYQFDIYSVEWKAYKLAAEKSLRVAAIHAMADRQYDRMDSAFIRAGLIDQTQDLFRAQFLPQPNGTTVYELVNCVSVAAPFRLLGASIWQAFSSLKSTSCPRDFIETLEIIDPFTVYSRKQMLAKGDAKVAWQSNIIRKYFPENDRCVFVARTVLEDELSPPKPTDVVEDKWIWMEVVPVDLCRCRLIALVQANFGVLPVLNKPSDCTNDVVDLINGLSITEEPLEPSKFPRLPESQRKISSRFRSLTCRSSPKMRDIFMRFSNA